MSEHVTLAKSRKKLTITVNEGDWFVLVQPNREFNAHLQEYRKIAHKAPINDDYERVITGCLSYSSSALNLVTAKQDEGRRKNQDEHLNRIEDAVKDAQVRQAKLEADQQSSREEAHANLLKKKNQGISEVRAATGQKAVAPVKPAVAPVAA